MKKENDYRLEDLRGKQADRLLNDPLIKEVLQGMRDALCKNLETSAWRDNEEREEIYRMLKTVTAFERELIKRVKAGKVALSYLEQLKKKVGAVKNRVVNI